MTVEAEVIALKEALYKQAHSIQELSDELDKERKAASSGADEALSMIFRLREERAMEKMKASQFKRITEAKMLHAEESVASLKESVLEKEREISTLKLQLQSYRQNMHKVGIGDTDIEEIKAFNNNGRVRRHVSMPSSWFDGLNLNMDNIDKNGSLVSSAPFIWSETAECSNQKSGRGIEFFSKKSVIEEISFNSEESKPLAEDNKSQQKASADTLCDTDFIRNRTVCSQFNYESLFESNSGCIHMNSRCRISPSSAGEMVHSTSIQDIYEVPNTFNENCECDSCKSTEGEVKSFSGSLADDLSCMTPLIMHSAWKYSSLENGLSTNSLQSEFEQLKKQVKKIENDQRIANEELSKRINEQLILIRGMQEQMNIQSQTKVSKHKISQQDEILFISFTEAILSFSL